jgi:hypothetical protein
MDLPGPDIAARDGLLALALAAFLVGAATGAAAQAGVSPFALNQQQVDADAVFLSVDLQSDGDAQWRVEYRVRLDDENTTAAFEDLQQDVEANRSTYTARFEDRMTNTVDDAAAATGREMAVRNVSVSTTTRQLPETYGVLVYTFEWTNFAVADGDRLQAGDALAGFFLDADGSLLLSWPEGYTLVEADPQPTEEREQSVVWRGPTDFGADGPTLVVSTAGGADGVDTSLVGLVLVGLVLFGGAGLWWWRNRSVGAPTEPDAASGSTAGTAEEPPPEELLSNEERVIALLEAHGGRMKQQAVVEELGWTDAKTSQVVGKLRESGEVEGFRLGRENVLRLPEVDKSPAPGEVVPDADEDDGAE